MATNDRLLVQILLLGLLAASLWVLAPFWSALFWAAVLAFASWPLMRLLTQLLNGRLSLAAGILTGVWVIMVAVPLVWALVVTFTTSVVSPGVRGFSV